MTELLALVGLIGCAIALLGIVREWEPLQPETVRVSFDSSEEFAKRPHPEDR